MDVSYFGQTFDLNDIKKEFYYWLRVQVWEQMQKKFSN